MTYEKAIMIYLQVAVLSLPEGSKESHEIPESVLAGGVVCDLRLRQL
jgi:hypothetical protein